MSRKDFVGQWVVTEVSGETAEKVGNHINTTLEGTEQIRIESSGHFLFCQVSCWEAEPPPWGQLVFTRTVNERNYHCTVLLHDSPGGRFLHCVEKAKPPGTDTGSWTAEDSSGPGEEG